MEKPPAIAKTSATNLVLGSGLIALGLAVCAGGIYVGESDDAPGAALLGFALMIALAVFGVKTIRRKG